MRTLIPTLLIGAATAAVVGWFTAGGWPGYVVGAALACSLWLMLFFGPSPDEGADASRVAAGRYLLASALGLVLGGAMFALGDDNAAFWAPGFIIAAVLLPSGALVTRWREQS